MRIIALLYQITANTYSEQKCWNSKQDQLHFSQTKPKLFYNRTFPDWLASTNTPIYVSDVIKSAIASQSNHRRLDCVLNWLFRCRSMKSSKIRFTGPCEGNPPVTEGFPSQKRSNTENVPFDDVIVPLEILRWLASFGLDRCQSCFRYIVVFCHHGSSTSTRHELAYLRGIDCLHCEIG